MHQTPTSKTTTTIRYSPFPIVALRHIVFFIYNETPFSGYLDITFFEYKDLFKKYFMFNLKYCIIIISSADLAARNFHNVMS